MSTPRGRQEKASPPQLHTRRLGIESRLKLLCAGLLVPGLAVAAGYLIAEHASFANAAAVLLAILLPGWILTAVLLEQVVRPLQTLSNVIGSLREEDFAFRARGTDGKDALGELAGEVNALAAALQERRVTAMEAAALLQRVVESMDTPMLAFDLSEVLRLLNPAAESLFGLSRAEGLGQSASALGLAHLLDQTEDGVVVIETRGRPARWMLHRTTFRQRGVPHTLFLLADVSAALREEERQAWQRLIRVLGHEINNSLAPIKSIAGSLRSQLRTTHAASARAEGSDPDRDADRDPDRDLDRGLRIIEGRAEALHRFVQAYRRLAQLPAPVLRETSLVGLLERTAALETRLPVEFVPGQDGVLCVDADQLEQMLINLLKNAVDAVMTPEEAFAPALPAREREPQVRISYHFGPVEAEIYIEDNGPGLTNPSNLFVPFYTTKPGGTGVGLALARQIAEAHGGVLELSNRESGGCRARVVLPRTRAAVPK